MYRRKSSHIRDPFDPVSTFLTVCCATSFWMDVPSGATWHATTQEHEAPWGAAVVAALTGRSVVGGVAEGRDLDPGISCPMAAGEWVMGASEAAAVVGPLVAGGHCSQTLLQTLDSTSCAAVCQFVR